MAILLTAAEMRAIEQAAIASGAVTGLALMERAGAGVVAEVLERWPGLAEGRRSACVLCGPGNNGGDGFVIARLLADRGWAVAAWLYGAPDKLPPDARANHDRWAEMGKVRALDPARPPDLTADLLVDALFGTGLTRPLTGFAPLWQAIAEARRRAPAALLVAVDIPSGLCADSGRVLADAPDGLPAPDLTVTFHSRKVGHALAGQQVGRLAVVDIGLPRTSGEPPCQTVERPVAARLAKASGAHKYAHGHALVLAGGFGRTGAARLAARAALRVGAGLVTVGAPADAMAECAAQLTSVMLREVEGAEDLAALLADRRIGVVCLGPGLGLHPGAADLVRSALDWHLPEDAALPLIDATGEQAAAFYRTHGHRPRAVLDADALTLLAADPDLFGRLHAGCLLTPHGGEFARLFPDLAARLAEPAATGPAWSKVDVVRAAAARAGCTVLLKGPITVIADPQGRAAIHAATGARAAPWLATAGAGDVLAGFITGLLARGFAPMEAAETAAWLHAEAARSFGPGLIAEDLPDQLPAVFRELGL